MISSQQSPPIHEHTLLIGTSPLFKEKITPHVQRAIEELKKITRHYTLFHISFFIVGCLELLAFILFFSFLTQSTILAFSIAGIFLSAFTYFVLLFYLQAKKPEELLAVRQDFLSYCQTSFSHEKGTFEYHQLISHILYQLIKELEHIEYSYYSIPEHFKTLSPLMKKFSAWCHWKDMHQIKEMLLETIIREQIQLVKIAPTALETHAALSSAYLCLAQLYQDPRKTNPQKTLTWIAPDYFSSEFKEKFTMANLRALEEFRILDTFAPNDPWIYSQLAAIYHDLDKPEEEIRAYESILTIAPQDREVLLRLGILYFKHGQPALSLRLYETLKNINDGKAEELISYYDAYQDNRLA